MKRVVKSKYGLLINDLLLFTLEDVTFLFYHVTYYENLIKGTDGLMGGSPSTKVTTVLSLVIVCLVF